MGELLNGNLHRRASEIGKGFGCRPGASGGPDTRAGVIGRLLLCWRVAELRRESVAVSVTMSGPFAGITPIRAMLFLTPHRRSRPRVADSQIKSLVIAPSRGAIESADRSLHNYFEQFTCLYADRICFDANPPYSGSNVGQRAIQRHWENGPSRTRRSLDSQSGGRWTWKGARNCRRAFDPLMTDGLR